MEQRGQHGRLEDYNMFGLGLISPYDHSDQEDGPNRPCPSHQAAVRDRSNLSENYQKSPGKIKICTVDIDMSMLDVSPLSCVHGRPGIVADAR